MVSTPSNFKELVAFFINFIELLVPLIFALTVLFLAWGVIRAWVINGGEPKSIDEGKKIAIAGVIALVVMIGVWGILEILKNSLGFR